MGFYRRGELFCVNAVSVKYRGGGRGQILNLKDKSGGNANGAAAEVAIPAAEGPERIKTSYSLLGAKANNHRKTYTEPFEYKTLKLIF